MPKVTKPAEGSQYRAADGTHYVIESVYDIEAEDDHPATYSVELVRSEDADDMSATGHDLTEDEFAAFVRDRGLTLA